MTKEDYQLIALTVAKLPATITRTGVVAELCKAFADNPAFNVAEFLYQSTPGLPYKVSVSDGGGK